MARRDDDIIKKLNKNRSAADRKNIKPLSSGDFAPKKSAFDLLVEQSEDRRRSKQKVKPAKRQQKRSASRKATDLASRYQSTQQKRQLSPPSPEIFVPESPKHAKPVTKPKPVKKPVRETAKPKTPEIFAPSTADAPKPSVKAKPKAPDIFATGTKPATRAKMPKHRAPQKRTRAKREMEIISPLTDTKRAASKAPMVSRKPARAAAAAKKGDVLQFRHEIKYYINYRDYTVLRGALRALMSLDENAGQNDMYHIRSLYFDDMYETALQQKVAGSDDRCKYRIRIYDYSDSCIKFEKKIKKGQFIAKQSILLSRDEYERIAAGEYDFLLDRDEPLAHEIYMKMKNELLRPRVLVDYQREAYVHPIENVRVTFDKDLKGGLSVTDIFNDKTPSMPMFDMGLMVLEVKFNRFLPESIKCVLNSLGAARRSAISKYVLCRKFD